jgi:hypothetical protein
MVEFIEKWDFMKDNNIVDPKGARACGLNSSGSG